MKKLSYLFVLTALFGFMACNTGSDKLQVKQIDSLLNLLDSADKKLAEVNFGSIDRKFHLYKEFSGLMTENYDAIKSDESFPYVCAYRNCKKSFSEFVGGYPIFRRELDSTKIQLENLKHDVENELIKEDEANSFIYQEKRNLTTLYERIVFKVDNANKEEANFDTVHPRIVGFLNDAGIKTGK